MPSVVDSTDRVVSPEIAPAEPSHSERVARAGNGRLDLLGGVVSCACACHCLALPAVVALVPALGLAPLLDERVESALLATTVALGVASFGPALRRAPIRGRWRTPALFLVGLLLMLAARVAEERGAGRVADAGLLIGAAAVTAAHVAQRRRVRRAALPTGADAAACCPCPDARPER